jgi:hypothetical protein
MFEKFTGKFLTNLFVYAFTSLFLGIPVIIYLLLKDYLWLGVVALGVFLFFVAYGTFKDVFETETKEYKGEIDKISGETNQQISIAQQNLKAAEAKEQMWRQVLVERAAGFPSLFEYIGMYDKLVDDYLSNQLIQKSHPAYKAAEDVKEQSARRREAEKKQRITQEIIEFYENLEPSLIEYKNEEFGDLDEVLQEWTDEEKGDPVSYFLSKEEYRRLSTAEKNQLALERYWKRPHSKWHIGIMYERYVGYLHEMKGFEVDYQGIKKKKEDLGRDVIARKGNDFIVIQCKYWSQFRKVFENEIFQFFGTVFQYKHSNKTKRVKGIFYTTTEVSDLARSFAKELDIELMEGFKMDKGYPCIKCNISIDGTKIYHLPFDQQYDNTKIEPNKGESYCATVKEAEEKGFRRAFRWKGTNTN